MNPTNNQALTSTLKTKEQFWNEHILLKRKRDQTRSAYCRKHKLSLIQFTYWEQKYNNKHANHTNSSNVSNLVPIKLDNSKPIISSAPVVSEILCVLNLKNGNELKVYNKSVIPLLLSALD